MMKREAPAFVDPMPQKRGEAVEKVDAGQMMPDIYEDWLKKQESREVTARSGFIGSQDIRLGERQQEQEEDDEDKREYELDRTEDVHEKAHRRKRGQGH